MTEMVFLSGAQSLIQLILQIILRKEEKLGFNRTLNSEARGMAVARPFSFEIDFVRNFSIFEIKIYEQKILDTKKISFSKPTSVGVKTK